MKLPHRSLVRETDRKLEPSTALFPRREFITQSLVAATLPVPLKRQIVCVWKCHFPVLFLLRQRRSRVSLAKQGKDEEGCADAGISHEGFVVLAPYHCAKSSGLILA